MPLVPVSPPCHGQADQSDIKQYMDISFLERKFAFDNISSPFQPLGAGSMNLIDNVK
jgi:hypothetical protein